MNGGGVCGFIYHFQSFCKFSIIDPRISTDQILLHLLLFLLMRRFSLFFFFNRPGGITNRSLSITPRARMCACVDLVSFISKDVYRRLCIYIAFLRDTTILFNKMGYPKVNIESNRA